MLKITKNKACSLLVTFLLAPFSLSSPLSAFAKPRDIFIDSIDHKLRVEEFAVAGTLRGAGGSLVVKDGAIIYARAQNDFVGIDIKDFSLKSHKLKSGSIRLIKNKQKILPNIITNASSMVTSIRYKSPEFIPKIEDLLYYNGAFFATHTFYDPLLDDIYFMVSMLNDGEIAWKAIFKSVALAAPYLAKGIGGAIAVKDGVLYVAVGDFSLDRVNGLPNDVSPQNSNFPWGKIMSIDLSNSYAVSVFSSGHRNPQGLIFLRDGSLLESEHGPRGGDELNIIKRGGNYGWPYRSFGTQYGSRLMYSDQIQPLPSELTGNFVEPIYAFLPSVATTGMAQIHEFDDKWNGDIILGSLKAETIFRIRLTENRVLFVEPIVVQRRVRKVIQYLGSIFALTDSGTILRLTIVK